MAGLLTPSCAYADADLSALAEVTGVSVEVLDSIAYRPTSEKYHNLFLGQELHREQFYTVRRQACVACLAEDGYHRAAWDLALSACFPKHRLRLVGACWHCKTKLGWQSADLDRCATCEANLASGRRQEVSEADAVSSADVFTLASGQACDWLPATLQEEHRSTLVRQVMTLGFIDLEWDDHRRPETLAMAGAEHVANIATAGIAILRAWPGSLVKLMERQLATENDRVGLYGANKSLGELYRWAVTLPEGGMRKSALETASNFLAQDKLRTHRLHRSELTGTLGSAETNITEAMALLDVTYARLKRFVAGGLLSIRNAEGQGKPAIVDRDQLAALVAVKDRLIDFIEACVLMGVSRNKLRPLVEAGLVPFVYRASKVGSGIWGFDSDQLLALLRELEGDASLGVAPGMVGFNSALEAYRLRGVGLIAFFRMLQHGGLKPVAVDGNKVGLNRLQFSKAEVLRACPALEAGQGSLNLQATAEQLGLKWEVVMHLTQHGVLATVDGQVTLEEIDRFRREVISGADLARAIGGHPRYMAVSLKEAGIEPITGPTIDGGRQNFYLKSEELLDELAGLQPRKDRAKPPKKAARPKTKASGKPVQHREASPDT